MKKILGLLTLCALTFAADLENDEIPVIHSPHGIYQGTTSESAVGEKFYSFRGIRYAHAPTDRDRFKQARIIEPHVGIYDATEDGPLCPQINSAVRVVAEDCLVLNVYVRKLPPLSTGNTQVNETGRPVLVFLHSGEFVVSSGTSYDFNPRNILVHDIVLVTLNYRLGALGFLSTGDSRAPGNAGLKDQVLALKWIQRNIAAFGGDPSKVTLAGHTTGAWCVTLHMVSPMSKGLFHRAFIIDGALPLHRPLPTNQLDLVKKQARVLRCPIDNLDNILNCLYLKPPIQIGNSVPNITDTMIYSLPTFTPVIEQANSENDDANEPFLTAQPLDIIRQRKANFVPFASGFDLVEFAKLPIHAYNHGPDGFFAAVDAFNEHWSENAPKLFGYDHNSRSSSITREFTSFYLDNKPLTAGQNEGIGELFDDAITVFPIHRFGRMLATYSNQPVFNYYNIYKCCGGFQKWSNGTHFSRPHYDELQLFFGIGSHPSLCKRDLAASMRLMGMINDFMKTGDPTPGNSSHEHSVKWESSTVDHPRYLEFGTEMRMVDEFIFPDRMNKWDELFPMESASSD